MYKIAIIGATGIVGRYILNILDEIKFPTAKILLTASNDSVGKKITHANQVLTVQPLSEKIFQNLDVVFFCANNAVSKKYVPIAISNSCIVIDKSSCFRMEANVPLVIPEINFNEVKNHKLIATPNCVAIPICMVLNTLKKLAKIEKIVCTTFQSVSGAGYKAIAELHNQTKGYLTNSAIKNDVFSKQIAFNVIPQVGKILDSGATEEEDKISHEIIKVMKENIKCDVTCVRVPVFIGHCISLNCTFDKVISEDEMFTTLHEDENLILLDRREEEIYATAMDAAGDDCVYISRVRQSQNCPKTYQFWIACDNLRKGAALNGIQIVCKMLGVSIG